MKEDFKVKEKLIKLLNRNARTSLSDLATVVGADEATVAAAIAEMEADGVIRGYKTIIDWEKLGNAYVSAIIELKVTPKAGLGFEDIAERVSRYPEVESVYLMSGVYDLNVVVKARSFQEVARFVAKELAPLESVTSTATHFVLRRYKDLDVELCTKREDERGTISL
jgi:DNA-binding Lrp family transcriptional regulator